MLVCQTHEEFSKFTTKFSQSQNQKEKKLYRYLQKELLPKILPIMIQHSQAIAAQKQSELDVILEEERRIMLLSTKILEQNEFFAKRLILQSYCLNMTHSP